MPLGKDGEVGSSQHINKGKGEKSTDVFKNIDPTTFSATISLLQTREARKFPRPFPVQNHIVITLDWGLSPIVLS
jgi:hypothetical protein